MDFGGRHGRRSLRPVGGTRCRLSALVPSFGNVTVLPQRTGNLERALWCRPVPDGPSAAPKVRVGIRRRSVPPPHPLPGRGMSPRKKCDHACQE
jgi:hypothetical protein